MESFESLEKDFFKLVGDLEAYPDSIVFVGGWLPHLYTKYLWGSKRIEPIATTDIDLGIKNFFGHPETLQKHLNELHYAVKPAYEDDQGNPLEDKIAYLIVTDIKEEIPIDFISGDPDPGQFIRLAGKELNVINSLENFDLLIKDEHCLKLDCSFEGRKYNLSIPKPSGYLYHKGITVEGRMQEKERDHKFKKDLWSIYYILANVPLKLEEELLNNVKTYHSDSDYEYFLEVLEKYFKTEKSFGPKAIQLFYPDFYEQIGQDAFERISNLRKYLSQ